MTVTIKITGPGQTFSLELLAIKEALEKEGVVVEIQDEFPLEAGMTLERHRAETAQWWIEADALCDSKGTPRWDRRQRHVKIIAEHCPWGG
jgi:hypothetical protein